MIRSYIRAAGFPFKAPTASPCDQLHADGGCSESGIKIIATRLPVFALSNNAASAASGQLCFHLPIRSCETRLSVQGSHSTCPLGNEMRYKKKPTGGFTKRASDVEDATPRVVTGLQKVVMVRGTPIIC